MISLEVAVCGGAKLYIAVVLLHSYLGQNYQLSSEQDSSARRSRAYWAADVDVYSHKSIGSVISTPG